MNTEGYTFSDKQTFNHKPNIESNGKLGETLHA